MLRHYRKANTPLCSATTTRRQHSIMLRHYKANTPLCSATTTRRQHSIMLRHYHKANTPLCSATTTRRQHSIMLRHYRKANTPLCSATTTRLTRMLRHYHKARPYITCRKANFFSTYCGKRPWKGTTEHQTHVVYITGNYDVVNSLL
jgi:peroxiredoxin